MNILIAEDHDLIVDGLKKLLEKEGYTIFHSSNEEGLFHVLKQKHIDLLIQDIRFGAVDARTILPKIIEDHPQLKILALTSLDDQASVQSVISAKVHGYVVKSEPTFIILEAIKCINAGETYLSPEVTQILSGRADYLPMVQLSKRERGTKRNFGRTINKGNSR